MALQQERPTLQPIIKRSQSPSQQAISNEALRSPTFVDEPPSPNVAAQPHSVAANKPQQTQQGSYFALQPNAASHSPAAGILLNRLDRDGRVSPGSMPAPEPVSGPAPALPHTSVFRVASPDGSASESGMSDPGAAPPSTAPTSAAGSPPPANSFGLAHKVNLSTLYTGGSAGTTGGVASDATPGSSSVANSTPADPSQPGSIRRVSSPPSPHCHFAPLPRVEGERPVSRRNSSANRVKPFVPKAPEGPKRTDSILATTSGVPSTSASGTSCLLSNRARSVESRPDARGFHPDADAGLPSPSRVWHAGDSSIPSAAALSQRLSSSLTFADAPSTLSPNATSGGAAGPVSPGSRPGSHPGSRRSSSSRRSRSPSPHYLNQNRERYRNPSAGSVSSGGGAGSDGRAHSPNLSRHASTDALSLHFIEQQREPAPREGARSESVSGGGGGARIISRTSSRAGSERDGGGSAVGGEGEPPVGGGGSGARSRHSSTSRVRPAASTAGSSSVSGFVDRDKEADLHRLESKALAGNADAERCVSPALRAHEEQQQQQRAATAAAVAAAAGATEPAGPAEAKSQVLKRNSSHEEVVQIRPPLRDEESSRGEGELEKVREEPEEGEAEAAALEGPGSDENEVNEEDEDEDDDVDDDDEDDENEEEEDQDEEEDEEDDIEEPSREEENDEEDDEEPAEEDRKTSLGAAVEVRLFGLLLLQKDLC